MGNRPIQPLYVDEHQVQRFEQNKIVRRLLDEGPFDMNDIDRWQDISDEDREQFAQLIGYSLSGFGELSYVKDDTYDIAERMAEGEDQELATVRALMGKVVAVRRHARALAVELFNIHPDDLE